jgi:hypothetical protein
VLLQPTPVANLMLQRLAVQRQTDRLQGVFQNKTSARLIRSRHPPNAQAEQPRMLPHSVCMSSQAQQLQAAGRTSSSS